MKFFASSEADAELKLAKEWRESVKKEPHYRDKRTELRNTGKLTEGSAGQILKKWVANQHGRFTSADVVAANPSIKRSTVYTYIGMFVADGKIVAVGKTAHNGNVYEAVK